MSDASKVQDDKSFFHVTPEQKSLVRTAARAITNPKFALAGIVRQSLKNELNKEAAKIKLNKNIHPETLNMYLDSLDPEWINWVPETIYQTVEEDSDQKLGDELRSKIQAIKTVRTTPEVAYDPLTLENVITAFNGHVPQWDAVEKPPLFEIAFAIDAIKKINPEFEVTDEARAFIASIMREDGLIYLPWVGMSVNDCSLGDVDAPICRMIDGLKKAWKNIDSRYDFIKDLDLKPDNPLSVQIDRLMDIRAYLDAQEANK